MKLKMNEKEKQRTELYEKWMKRKNKEMNDKKNEWKGETKKWMKWRIDEEQKLRKNEWKGKELMNEGKKKTQDY